MTKNQALDAAQSFPTGCAPTDIQKLDKRLTEWLAWRGGKAPPPAWHPASKKSHAPNSAPNPQSK